MTVTTGPRRQGDGATDSANQSRTSCTRLQRDLAAIAALGMVTSNSTCTGGELDGAPCAPIGTEAEASATATTAEVDAPTNAAIAAADLLESNATRYLQNGNGIRGGLTSVRSEDSKDGSRIHGADADHAIALEDC